MLSLAIRRTTQARHLMARRHAAHLVITTPPKEATCPRCGQIEVELTPESQQPSGRVRATLARGAARPRMQSSPTETGCL